MSLSQHKTLDHCNCSVSKILLTSQFSQIIFDIILSIKSFLTSHHTCVLQLDDKYLVWW